MGIRRWMLGKATAALEKENARLQAKVTRLELEALRYKVEIEGTALSDVVGRQRVLDTINRINADANTRAIITRDDGTTTSIPRPGKVNLPKTKDDIMKDQLKEMLRRKEYEADSKNK